MRVPPISSRARREPFPFPRPLSFRFVEAGHTDHAQAPELRFIPDAEACRVHVDAWFGNPATTEPVRIAPNVRISLLSEHLVVDLATEFVFDVLRSREPDLRAPEPALPPEAKAEEDDDGESVPDTPPRSKTMSREPVQHPINGPTRASSSTGSTSGEGAGPDATMTVSRPPPDGL